MQEGGGLKDLSLVGRTHVMLPVWAPGEKGGSKLRLDEHVVLFIPRQMRQIFCFCFVLFCVYLHKVVSRTPLSQESRVPDRVQLHVNLNTPKTAIISSSFNLSPVLFCDYFDSHTTRSRRNKLRVRLCVIYLYTLLILFVNICNLFFSYLNSTFWRSSADVKYCI